MGKTNFSGLYRHIKRRLGDVKIKQSYYSDTYRPGRNYAGVIVYMVDGDTSWTNRTGRSSGMKGRACYVVIQCTDQWPQEYLRDAGNGMVHHYLLKNVFGIDYHQDRILCSGFAFHNGILKFSSIWLNGRTQREWNSDGSKYLCDGERVLVDFVFRDWRDNGKHRVVPVPKHVELSIELYGLGLQ